MPSRSCPGRQDAGKMMGRRERGLEFKLKHRLEHSVIGADLTIVLWLGAQKIKSLNRIIPSKIRLANTTAIHMQMDTIWRKINRITITI